MSKIIDIPSANAKKRVGLIMLIAVMVLVTILGTMAVFMPLKNGRPLINGGSFKEDDSSASSTKNTDEELQTKVQQLVDTDKPEEAEKIIRDDSKFETDWYRHSLLADVYLNTNQLDKALETLLDMEKKFGIGQYTTAARIAELYLTSGNKEQAVRYYQKSIELVRDSNTPTREWEIDQLEQKIGDIK